MRHKKTILYILALALALWGSRAMVQGLDAAPTPSGADLGRPLVFCTTGSATTPQMPFWATVAHNKLPEFDNLKVNYWKNLDDLRATVLAGRGDIWLGHVEGFAQAAMHGAPVRLLAVTGWKKFSILTQCDEVRTLDDLLKSKTPPSLAIAPPQSPALPLMRSLEKHGLPTLSYEPCEPRQLLLDLKRGRVQHLITPEPLTTVLLRRVPGLRVVAGVEELYSRLAGGPPCLPIAGIAVHARLCETHPQLVRALLQGMIQSQQALSQDPVAGLGHFPAEFSKFIDPDVVRDSLSRDMVRVVQASKCRQSVQDYLAAVLSKTQDLTLPEDFYWE